jgi:hypothetical protein
MTKKFTKIRMLFPYLGIVVAAGILASCGSSNQFASHFSKRKYTKGIFLDPVAKVKTQARDNSTEVAAVTKKENSVFPAKSVNPIEVVKQNNAVASVNAGNNVSTSKHSFISRFIANLKTVSLNANDYKVAKSAPSWTTVSSADNFAPPAVGHTGGGCKSWILCLVLCWLLGGLGIHRFYMGYIWQGVVQLLTGGGCGIWWLIDFIRIIMKSLKPKDGDYCD